MFHSTTRKTFAVVVALLVACSFVAAPAAAVAESGTGLDTLSTGDSTGPDTDTDGETDDETEDEEDAEDTEDAEEDEDADDADSDGSDDAEGEDADTEDSDDEESDSDDTEEDDTDERTSENVTDAVEDTVDGVTDGVEETADAVEGTVDDVEETAGGNLAEAEALEAASDDVVGPLEELGADGVDIVELVRSLDVELRGADGDDGTTSPRSERPGVHGEHDPAPAESMELRPAVPEDADDGAADADDVDGSDDESPAPSDPGAVVAFGAVATAVALRGGPVVSGGRAAASGGWLSALLERLPPFLVPLRYSRYDDSDPLEHEARERVYEIVNETPGSYLSEVSDEADLPLSTTRHHIKVLEREDLVTGAKLHGKRRFYPAYAEGIELAAALNDESTATIIRAIARIGSASVSDLADELGRDPSTVSHHLQRLEEDGLVTREREGRAVVNRLSAEARTALEPEAAPGVGEASEVVAGGAD